MIARWLLALLLVLLPTVAGAQIVDKTQNSAPFGLNAAAASWAGCVYPPSVVASCVKLDYQGYQGVAALLKGTWAGTVVAGISADGGTTVTDVNLISAAGVSAASVTAAGLYNPSTVSGAQMFLVRVSVYTSGSVDVVLRGTSAQARGTPIGGGPPAPSNATYLTATAESGLGAEVNLGALTTGVLYHTVSAGTSTPAVIACTAGVLMGGAPPTCTLTPAGLTSVGIGTTSPATELTVASTVTTSPRGIMSAQYNTGTDGARLHMRKGRGTEGTPLVVVTGDNLGRLVASGYDGANYLEMASIIFGTEGTIASTRVPTNIIFQTATNATPSVLTTRLTIDSAGLAAFTGAISVAGSVTVGASGFISMDGGAFNNPRKISTSAANVPIELQTQQGTLTSGGLSGILIDNGGGGFIPGSGSASYAALHVLPIINGTSSGTAYGLLLASKTNVLTGGAIKLASFGTTTTDGYTGYTPRWTLDVTGYVEGIEQTAPAAPAANAYRLYAQDSGGGKTQLCVLFATGAAQCFAAEP